MEKIIFGHKVDGFNYEVRKGVYGVIFNFTKEKVLSVQTPSGFHFLPGGGIENNEQPEDCLKREMLEESGYGILLISYIGEASRFFNSRRNEYIQNEGYFYIGELLEHIKDPIEIDHLLRWVFLKDIKELFFHEHHTWAIKQAKEITKGKNR